MRKDRSRWSGCGRQVPRDLQRLGLSRGVGAGTCNPSWCLCREPAGQRTRTKQQLSSLRSLTGLFPSPVLLPHTAVPRPLGASICLIILSTKGPPSNILPHPSLFSMEQWHDVQSFCFSSVSSPSWTHGERTHTHFVQGSAWQEADRCLSDRYQTNHSSPHPHHKGHGSEGPCAWLDALIILGGGSRIFVLHRAPRIS